MKTTTAMVAVCCDPLARDRAGDLLSEDDFYRGGHRKIFSAISTLAAANKPADVIAVYEHWRASTNATSEGLVYLNLPQLKSESNEQLSLQGDGCHADRGCCSGREIKANATPGSLPTCPSQ